MSLRVVFDTSTLIGAAIRPDSIPDRALQRALGSHDLFVSAETLQELDRVLRKKGLNRYQKLENRLSFARAIQDNATQLAVTSSESTVARGVCRDPTDAKFLALAIAARADILVSSDLDLLVLHPWRGIPILTPAQFLTQFAM
jgi:putative PIN family toxin of toxin-antitoxin system